VRTMAGLKRTRVDGQLAKDAYYGRAEDEEELPVSKIIPAEIMKFYYISFHCCNCI
jgi:hypothetical protein